jgi:hypothetical protein
MIFEFYTNLNEYLPKKGAYAPFFNDNFIFFYLNQMMT